jgi:hypothetical protein
VRLRLTALGLDRLTEQVTTLDRVASTAAELVAAQLTREFDLSLSWTAHCCASSAPTTETGCGIKCHLDEPTVVASTTAA